MYKGEYNHTIDAKGRIIVPAKLREELGDSFVVTKGLDGCLWMLDSTEWGKLEEQIRKIPFFAKEGRKISRLLLAGAYDAELDKQGRVVLPAGLREHADITKDVVLAGVGNRVEIWSKERYEDESNFDDIEDIAQKLVELGFDF